MKSWPNKRTLLYGEEEYSLTSHHQYDLVFMPNYEINKIGPKSVDLFMNIHSLGEMTKETVTHYINCISKSTKPLSIFSVPRTGIRPAATPYKTLRFLHFPAREERWGFFYTPFYAKPL